MSIKDQEIDRLTAENKELLERLVRREGDYTHVADELDFAKQEIKNLNHQIEAECIVSDGYRQERDQLRESLTELETEVIARFVKSLTSDQTLHLHNMTPNERVEYINEIRSK